MLRSLKVFLFLVVCLTIANYHVFAAFAVSKTIPLTGSGGFDFLTADPIGHRLYVARSSEIIVVDLVTGAQAGSVKGMSGAHGVAIANEFNKGFGTNGSAGTVTVFDLKTLAVLATVTVGSNPDYIMYDPFTKRVFSFNAGAGTVTAINAATNAVAGTVTSVGSGLELAGSDLAGRLYVGMLSSGGVGVIDAVGLTKVATWSIAPDGGSRTICVDPTIDRVFNGGSGNIHAFSIKTGTKVAMTPNIGGSDGMEYDPATKTLVVAGGGKALIVKWATGDVFTPTNLTVPGAGKTIGVDISTHTFWFVGPSGSSVIGVSDGSVNIEPITKLNRTRPSAVLWTGTNMEFSRPGLHVEAPTFFLNGKNTGIVPKSAK